MQNKNIMSEEIDKNSDVLYSSKEIKDLLNISSKNLMIYDALVTNNDSYNVTTLKYRKSRGMTYIKLLASENILNRLILSTFLKIKIHTIENKSLDIDFKDNDLIDFSVYLNSNKGTIIKIKFKESDDKNEI